MATSITSVTPGQKECITVIKDVARKAADAAIDELLESGVINSSNLQRVFGQNNKITPAIQTFVKRLIAQLAENISGCVKLISGAETLTLDSTDGVETLFQAGGVFSCIDPDFKDWGLNVKSEPTGPTNVAVHEVIKDGTFEQIFGGLSSNLDSLCLTQTQIIQFATKYRKWLRGDYYATFFLFKVDGKLFVARVRVRGDGSLGVHLHHFSYDSVWHAGYRHRVVVPQLTLET